MENQRLADQLRQKVSELNSLLIESAKAGLTIYVEHTSGGSIAVSHESGLKATQLSVVVQHVTEY